MASTRLIVVDVMPTFQPGDPAPRGLLEWHEWARVQHQAGRRQFRCARCDRWEFPGEGCRETAGGRMADWDEAAARELLAKEEKWASVGSPAQGAHGEFARHLAGAFAALDATRARLAQAEFERDSLRMERDGLEQIRVKDNQYLLDKVAQAERERDEARARLEAVATVVSGGPVSDFMASFPEVRDALDVCATLDRSQRTIADLSRDVERLGAECDPKE